MIGNRASGAEHKPHRPHKHGQRMKFDLSGGTENDGGWVVDYLKISPAGSLDWRGHATVRAVDILRRNAPSAAAASS